MSPLVLDGKILPILVICFLKQSATYTKLRVVGGRDAEPHEYPYVVRLEVRYLDKSLEPPKYDHEHVCTAAAITSTWTLTAAHCEEGIHILMAVLDSLPAREQLKAVVRYNAATGYLSESDSFSDVIFHKYPAYKSLFSQSHNDVALLKTTPIKLEWYGKLSAADFSTLAGHRAHAMGYGYTNKSNEIDTTKVLGMTLQILEVVIRACHSQTLGLYPTICISRRCGQSASICPGDSGGPLVHVSGIVGINSKAVIKDCEKKSLKENLSSNAVGAITPISPYVEWISDQIAKDRDS